LALQDVAVTEDEERMLGVAVLQETITGLQPSMSRVEKRVVGMCEAYHVAEHPLIIF
jgi:WD repeat-containing protein 26